MISEIKMPKLGLTMTEGTITKWFFHEGDAVKSGDELLELTTDKLASTVEASCDGLLLKIYAQAETEVPVGALLAVLGEAGDQAPEMTGTAAAQASAALTGPDAAGSTEPSPPAAAIPPAAAPKEAAAGVAVQPGGRVKASPLAKKLALQKGYAVDQIPGSGPGGRIVKTDVENFVSPAAASTVSTAATAAPATAAASADVRPLIGMRKVISERMTQSWQMSPHVTLNREIDMTELSRVREKLTEAGQKASYTEFIVKACAGILIEMPEVNRSLIDGMIHTHGTASIGVAVALPDGLIVPVVKDAQNKSVPEIRAAVKDLSRRARDGKATADELTGGTFTVSNLGMYGIDTFTPVINPPESAILGVNRVVKKPVIVEADGVDRIEIRPMMNLSLSVDHRLVDGATGAMFLQKLTGLLENPYLLF
jgi:pyruvate dehydrogenase E2 component (dihydrolipoamide acetyltransferase)